MLCGSSTHCKATIFRFEIKLISSLRLSAIVHRVLQAIHKGTHTHTHTPGNIIPSANARDAGTNVLRPGPRNNTRSDRCGLSQNNCEVSAMHANCASPASRAHSHVSTCLVRAAGDRRWPFSRPHAITHPKTFQNAHQAQTTRRSCAFQLTPRARRFADA